MIVNLTGEEILAIHNALSCQEGLKHRDKAFSTINSIGIEMGTIVKVQTKHGLWEAMLCQVDNNKGNLIDLKDGNRILDDTVELISGKASIKKLFETYRLEHLDIIGKYNDTNN